jgi:hypothetical protein
MNRSVFWALVRKDLYLMRGLTVAIIVAGILAFAMMRWGKIGFAVGGILFLTTNVAGAIFIAMLSILTDRVKNSRLFALSLPISGAQHALTKLVSAWLTYGIPWLVLTGFVLLSFLLHKGAEHGMVVYVAMLQGFVLALFSVVVAALFVIRSEPLSGVMIIVVNIAFSLFMVKVNQPDVVGGMHGEAIIWTPFSLAMLAGEALVILLSLAFVMFTTSRNRDHL